MIPPQEEPKPAQFRSIKSSLLSQDQKKSMLTFKNSIPHPKILKEEPVFDRTNPKFIRRSQDNSKELDRSNEKKYPYKFVSSHLNKDIKTLKEEIKKINPLKDDIEEGTTRWNSVIKQPNDQKAKELEDKISTLQAQLQIAQGENKVLKGELDLNKEMNKTLKKELQRLKKQIFNSTQRSIQSELQQKWNEQRKTYEDIIQKLRKNQQQLQRVDPYFEQSQKTFDDSLKIQININKELKQKLLKKEKQLDEMTQKYLLKTKQIQKVKEDHRIGDLIANNQQKNKIIRLEHQLQQKNCDIQFAQISLQSLHARNKRTIQELTDKDQFMMTYFINQQGAQDIVKIMNIYKQMLQNHTTWRDYLMDKKQLNSLREAVNKIND